MLKEALSIVNCKHWDLDHKTDGNKDAQLKQEEVVAADADA